MRWTSIGCTAPDLNAEPHATAGSRRIYYAHPDGRYCYRVASWGEHGTGSHGFRCEGDGYPCDGRGRKVAGDLIPSAELDGESFVPQSVGDKIREWIENDPRTLKELGEACRPVMSVVQVSEIKRGRRANISIKTADRIRRACGKDWADLDN